MSGDIELGKQAVQLANAVVLPMVLKSALELNIIDTIYAAGDGVFLSPSEISSKIPTKNPETPILLDRILRLLASHSILDCSVETKENREIERLYAAKPICKFLTKNSGKGSFAPLFLLHHDKVFMESWFHLNDVILEGGIPFNRAYGMTAFEYPGIDQRFNKIKGINFDLHHVLADAPSYPGVEHIGGDMFQSVPKGDAIFMWILHDWSDDHSLKLLKNCIESLPLGGKVIIVESILPVALDGSVSSSIACRQDLFMLAQNPGGKERTEKEYEGLAVKSGFSGCEVICCGYNSWVMEFHKRANP